MKQDKQKRNWIIDAVLFGGFLVALWLDLTGLAVHQWLGIAVGALAGYHLVAHWSWVEAVTGRLLGRTSKQSRQFYAVDAGLAVGFVTIAATGLAISTWLNLSLTSYVIWRNIHVLASVVTLALVVGKIGLHWRWIVSTARRRIFPAPAPVRQASPGQPEPVATQMGRRDFARLMAGVGAVALLAGVNALSGTAGDQAEAAPATQQAGDAADQANASSASTVKSCVVRCGRRCSYPGHCQRYTDPNNNGRCDLGECLS
jgi:hypothetical protein